MFSTKIKPSINTDQNCAFSTKHLKRTTRHIYRHFALDILHTYANNLVKDLVQFNTVCSVPVRPRRRSGTGIVALGGDDTKHQLPNDVGEFISGPLHYSPVQQQQLYAASAGTMDVLTANAQDNGKRRPKQPQLCSNATRE